MYDVEKVRSDFTALQHGTYLNTGSIGAPADRVRRTYLDAYQEFALHSQDHFHTSFEGHTERIAQLAGFFGADPHEVTACTNASVAINIGVMGRDWQPGDHVVMSNEEHPSGYVPWYSLRDRVGIEITEVPLTNDADDIVAAIEAAMTPKTRMVFLSHVSCRTGLRIPVRPLADMIHQKGALFYLDGAQSAGQFAIDLHAYDCDFYSTSCHKWLHAPISSGLFYVKDAVLDRLKDSWCGPSSQFDFFAFLDGSKTFAQAFNHHAGRFEIGSVDCAKSVGVKAAVDYVNELGLENIAAHVKSLADPLKAELQSIPGVTLLTPTDEALHSNGIVAFTMDGIGAMSFRMRLHEDNKIFLRTIDELNATRASIALFTNQADLDLLLEHVRDTLKG